jgi:hypothetical protein
MHPAFVTRGGATPIPIWFVTAATWRDIRAGLDERACAFAEAAGFEPSPGRHTLLPGPDGTLAAVLFGLEDHAKPFNPFLPGTLAGLLPPGVYRFANAAHDQRLAALAVALGAYRFVRYGKPANEVRLEVPEQADGAELTRMVDAVYLARDLINTPANDMGPGELADAATHSWREKRVIDHGWTESGNLWLAARLPELRSRFVLGIPSAIRRFVEGREFPAADELGLTTGIIRITADGNASYGYGQTGWETYSPVTSA